MTKVSIGIPTYNRPEGLARTLSQICGQTHKDLEIVVSNNASTDPGVREVLEDFEKKDGRISIYHQSENKGLFYNFLEVLRLSTSKYFMWAADDDEWDPTFIQVCHDVLESENVGSVAPGFRAYNSVTNVLYHPPFPKMYGVDRINEALLFFRDLPHTMFYGLHRRESLQYVLSGYDDETLVDDELIIPRQIIQTGYITLPELWLHTSWINTAVYQLKNTLEAPNHNILYYKRIVHFINFIAERDDATDIQKLQLIQAFVLQKLNTLLFFEKDIRKPEQYNLAFHLKELLSRVDFDQLSGYAQLLGMIEQIGAKRG